ncbi:hypothetical protein PC9H_000412 [Pleurotus ostreatus]|uniref:Ricin B lectin domain-containing protein n=2 Tax=Pleurotus ostreatus TaxID=5322 RepID=A0A8H7A454_PLEOS|nr:uncharacterized protein PC9H_000412 [Pleurotus ostreatus]KAF7440069.1 hypothetical protein PC9H_000412 [Pleurotus ostreatus]KAJ8700685.1 hypothetical protein PTI98_003687 [Pleurotus ostreatus]
MLTKLFVVFFAAVAMASAIDMDALIARQATTTTTTTSTSTTSTSTSTTSTATTTTSGSTTTSSTTTTTSSSVAPTTSLPPNEAGVQIHPNFSSNKCLDVRGNTLANGTPVQIYDCNGTGAQKWAISRGQTHVRLAGTNFCLDAGSRPGNGVGMKIWTCFDNLPAQEWYYTGDNRIALFNKGLCLDLTDGSLTNSRQTQTWKCTDFNTNQIWNV